MEIAWWINFGTIIMLPLQKHSLIKQTYYFLCDGVGMCLLATVSLWIYSEHLLFIYYICIPSYEDRSNRREMKWDTHKNNNNNKKHWLWMRSSEWDIMEKWREVIPIQCVLINGITISSGKLLVIRRDVSPPVERLSSHIVQQALIRLPWPPGVLISIACGRGNPR